MISAPRTVHAQETASRDMGVYWSALATAPSIAAASTVAKPPSLVADGLLRLRTYEIGLDRTDAFNAIRTLERAVAASPNDPWAHFALGAMLARGPDIRARAYAENNAYLPQPNSNAAVRAPRALKRALELDPSMDVAAFELANLALDLHDHRLMADAIEALTAESRDTNGRALLLAAKLQNRLAAPASGARLAREAKQFGIDASVSLHEEAVATFRTRSEMQRAAGLYFAGVDSLSTESAAMYFADVALIVNAREEDQWHAARLDGRRKWLRAFWAKHAALAGVTVERRLEEHFRRMERNETVRAPVLSGTADSTKRTPNIATLIVGTKPSLIENEDNQALIADLRHGDPTRPEKFVYCAPGWDTLPVPMQPTLQECMGSPYGRMRRKYWNRIYQWQGVEKGLEGASFYPAYVRTVPLAWEALQFRAAGGGAEVFAAIAMTGASARLLRDDTDVIAPTLTIALTDTIRDWVRTATSNPRLAANAIPDASMALFRVSTTAPEGRRVALRVGIENIAGSIGTIASGTIDVESFHADSLRMSDVVISPPDATGTLERGDVRVALAPGRSYTQDEVPTLYYEVYGVGVGAVVSTEIRITPVRDAALQRLRAALGRSDGSVSFTFEEPAGAISPAFGLQQTRTIGLTSLVPGDYRVTVTVTDTRSGRTTSRVKSLQIDP